jgi:excisionase family DNA binding protein
MNAKIRKAEIRHLTPALSPIEAERVANAPCVTRSEFAVMLHVSLRTVDRMIAAKEIPVHRVRDKTVRILRSDAERYINGEKLPSEVAAHFTGQGNLKTRNQTGASAPETKQVKTPK